MTLRMTRRGILLGIAATASAVAVPLGLRRLRRGEEARRPDPPAGADESPFPYLNLDTSALDMFKADYRRHHGSELPAGAWPEEARLQFLLSTDFFRFDADEGRRVSYVGYYDPAVTPCNNPLARFD